MYLSLQFSYILSDSENAVAVKTTPTKATVDERYSNQEINFFQIFSTSNSKFSLKTHKLMKEHDLRYSLFRKEFLQEIDFMKSLEYHPHVLTMLGCSTNIQYPILVTELCGMGDLLRLLREMNLETSQVMNNTFHSLVWIVLYFNEETHL